MDFHLPENCFHCYPLETTTTPAHYVLLAKSESPHLCFPYLYGYKPEDFINFDHQD